LIKNKKRVIKNQLLKQLVEDSADCFFMYYFFLSFIFIAASSCLK
jgi:hypothetical protein